MNKHILLSVKKIFLSISIYSTFSAFNNIFKHFIIIKMKPSLASFL